MDAEMQLYFFSGKLTFPTVWVSTQCWHLNGGVLYTGLNSLFSSVYFRPFSYLQILSRRRLYTAPDWSTEIKPEKAAYLQNPKMSSRAEKSPSF